MPSFLTSYPIKMCSNNWFSDDCIHQEPAKQKSTKKPRSLSFTGSVVKLWEAVREHVTFNHRDVVRGIGATHLGSPSHEPHATIFSHVLSLPGEEQEFRKATTYAASSVTEEDMAECTTSPTRTERENPCLLVVSLYSTA